MLVYLSRLIYKNMFSYCYYSLLVLYFSHRYLSVRWEVQKRFALIVQTSGKQFERIYKTEKWST